MAAVACKMSSMVLLAPLCLTQARTKAVTFSFVIGNQRLETTVIGVKRCRYVHTSSRTYKIFEVPSELEANTLRKAFPNPKGLIHRLLEPLVSCGMTDAPHLNVAPRLGGQFWRARLHLQWPGKVTISAVHSSITGAEENVYLLACDLFKNIGLLYGQGSGEISPVDQGYVLSLLQALHTPRWPDPFSRHTKLHFHFTTAPAEPPQLRLSTEGREDGEGRRGRWCTNVTTSWPYSFQVRCVAPTWEASQHAAVLQTCIKLKVSGGGERIAGGVWVWSLVTNLVGPQEPLLATIKRYELVWFGHLTQHDSLFKAPSKEDVSVGDKGRAGQDNLKDWTDMTMPDLLSMAANRTAWRRLSASFALGSPRRLPSQGTE